MRRKQLQELASEVTSALLAMTPGASVIVKLVPTTSKQAIRKLFGLDRASALEQLITHTLEAICDDIFKGIDAVPGSHEFNAPAGAIEDFQVSLREASLTIDLIINALIEPLLLEEAIKKACPDEHLRWASDLRRTTFNLVVEKFCPAILAAASQLPAVQAAIAVQTLKLLHELHTAR